MRISDRRVGEKAQIADPPFALATCRGSTAATCRAPATIDTMFGELAKRPAAIAGAGAAAVCVWLLITNWGPSLRAIPPI